jgi:ATP-binding cassette subfamily B protein
MGFHGGGRMTGIFSESEKPKITRALLMRVFTYARPYWPQIAGMLFLILISSGLSLINPLILRQLIDHALPEKDLNGLLLLAGALLLLPLVSGAVNVIQRRLNAGVGEGVIFDLRVALYDHLERLSLRFFTHTRTGELMSRLNNDVVGAQTAISNTLVGIVTEIIQAAVLLAVMLAMEWRLTLISVIILPLFIFASQKMSTRLRDIAREQMDANARMNALMNETLNISGALLVKLFGQRKNEVARFEDRAVNVRDIGIRRAITGTVFIVIIGLLSAVGNALIYGFGGYLVIQNAFTIGTIVAFGSYLGSLYSALSSLSSAPVDFATSIVSFERVFEVLDLPLEIAEAEHPLEISQVRGELAFEHVSFRYDEGINEYLKSVRRFGQLDSVATTISAPANADGTPAADGEVHHQARESALEDISFVVKPGQLAALVGPSGAGKTTLTYLVPRLYDPTEGIIRVDGHDLRDYRLESLMGQIGMVTQETHLFHDSIRTNLLYAKPDATQADLESACKAANIHDFVSHLSEGYDTVVGERGYRLSGGEKQRIALARVILKDPRILILDEATSHLDSESEALIQDALNHVMAGRTSIVIAHRLSTILAADLILVMDRGRIVESGVHADLVQRGGLYAHLYETQFHNADKTTA